jgi:predicted peroxiredoxin
MFAVPDLPAFGIVIIMTVKKELERSLMVIGTHSDDNLEKAMLTFMVANASEALGIKTKVFLMSKGTSLVRKNYAKSMPKMVGMEPMEDLISSFQEMGGIIHVCVPCKDARGIKTSEFIAGIEFSTLMDLAEITQTNSRVISF